MKGRIGAGLNLKLLGLILGGIMIAAGIARYASSSYSNVGAPTIVQTALHIASHITGNNLDHYNVGDPGFQDVIAYWKKICKGSICPDAQPTSFQGAMFISTVYGMAGHTLPQVYGGAVDYWAGYKNRPGWQEIPVGSGFPLPGDLMVWGGGDVRAGYPQGIGHVAIVVAVQLPNNGMATPTATSGAKGAISAPINGTNKVTPTPTSMVNGSVTVAQANVLGGGIVGGDDKVGYNLVTPDPRVPSITMPGIHLYQMPLLSDLTVHTWAGYTALGYIRNTSLIQSMGNSLSSKYTVTGQPTITVDKINSILATYKSPAAGTGQELYSLGVQYGIDPVFALAFFHHESSFGTTGVARVTLALGNERCIPDRPCVDQNGNPLPNSSSNGYAKMNSWVDGFEHWYMLISGPLYVKGGLTTVDQIIPKYAPAADHNNETAYIQAVEQDVDQWRSGK